MTVVTTSSLSFFFIALFLILSPMSPRIALPLLVDAFSLTRAMKKIPIKKNTLNYRIANPSRALRQSSGENNANQSATVVSNSTSLYKSEGIFAVSKPLGWTSQDVVSFTRKMLERDCRQRGLRVAKLRKRGNKNRMVKVGHGGTLDPLASGVLVIGVGRGTKLLQDYLSGSKRYTASAELGFETTTLDMDGDVVRRAPYDHVTMESLKDALPAFQGNIMQVPPIYSAIKKDGKKLYDEARAGKTAEELQLQPREVQVYALDLLDKDGNMISDCATPSTSNNDFVPVFGLDVECGGGTYIRSLIRDIGIALGSAATMTSLVRTQHGPFQLKHILPWEDLNPDNIYNAIDEAKELLLTEEPLE